MTAPIKALALPEIDLEGLARIVAEKERGNAEATYRTRTQAMLEDNEARAQALETEITVLRQDNAEFESLIGRLQALLRKRQTFEADLAVELAITHAAVAGLKQAGVSLAQAQREEVEK